MESFWFRPLFLLLVFAGFKAQFSPFRALVEEQESSQGNTAVYQHSLI